MSSSRIITDYLSIALGLYPRAERTLIFGNNPDVDTGSIPEDIWPLGGLYPFKPTATLMQVVSSSAADTAAGTGARTVQVTGVGALYQFLSETVTLNGVVPVPTANSYLRINECTVLTSGSGGVNAGNVDTRDLVGAVVRDRIPAGTGISRKAVFTVPLNRTLYAISTLVSVNSGTGTTPSATVGGIIRNAQGNFNMPLEFTASSVVPYKHDRQLPILLPEKTDIVLRCTAVGGNNTNLSAAFEGFMVTDIARVF